MGIPTVYTTKEIKGRSIENIDTKNLIRECYVTTKYEGFFKILAHDHDGDRFWFYSREDKTFQFNFEYELYDYVSCVRIVEGAEMNRKEALELAIKTVYEDRQDIHGAPEDCFALIGEYWSKYLDVEIDSVDVARMMMFFKMARLMMNPKHIDNYTDLMGYAALAVELIGDDGE